MLSKYGIIIPNAETKQYIKQIESEVFWCTNVIDSTLDWSYFMHIPVKARQIDPDSISNYFGSFAKIKIKRYSNTNIPFIVGV